MCTLSLLLFLFTALTTAQAEIRTAELEWEQACGGSVITVTTDDGQISLVEAYSEHFAEAREWICLFQQGQLVSAVYRQHELTRRSTEEDESSFIIVRKTVHERTFMARDGKPLGAIPELQKDFSAVMEKAEAHVRKQG